MIKPKTTVAHYYNFLPPPEHAPGDIWSDLPTHGLLKSSTTSGLIITPACDLQNRKVETITYLPILTVRSYFASIAFASEIATQTNSLISQLNDATNLKIPLLDRRPDPDKLSETLTTIKEASVNPNKKNIQDRAIKGVEQLLRTIDSSQHEADCQALQLVFGRKDWKTTCEKLAKGSLRPDLHFLPSDNQDASWAGVPAHSVVLFRYPLTVPIEILDLAQDVRQSDWQTAMQSFAKVQSIAAAFSIRPIKRIRLQNRIMADLLTRYLSLYSRIGSPDFSQETVESYIKDFGGIE